MKNNNQELNERLMLNRIRVYYEYFGCDMSSVCNDVIKERLARQNISIADAENRLRLIQELIRDYLKKKTPKNQVKKFVL
ncbi:MAG: hypothetical protein GWM89_00085 [Candidatus Dadabacteria bacterium]|nr:hypothetical protein [Candidatus Dadabacteria bacterium]NIY20841.1 hypothetical protein [Candidatus Dadabacteria bacterium]